MESRNQGLAAINSWFLKWHMRLNPKKTMFMAVSRSQPIAPSYDELALGGAELEELKSLRIVGVALDSKLTFETLLRGVVSRQSGVWKSCTKQARYLIVHVSSRNVSMHMFVQFEILCPLVDVVCGNSFCFFV